MKYQLLLFLAAFFCISTAYGRRNTYSSAYQKKDTARIIQGTVTDSTGKLAGVTVGIRGTTKSTMSDESGLYVISVPADTSVLVFSMVGYTTQRVSTLNKKVVNVKLIKSSKDLDQVVVVAFGAQKRKEVVGSVTTITPADLKIPSSNLTTALAGRAAGMIAYQRSGEPGRDNADFFVRGVTTFGYKRDPLILIDGMELTTTDLARLQPDDISSFSIMKDATATALYGARGANGVILVITKQGAMGKAKLSMRAENSVSAPTKNIELADPITYMKMGNEAVLTRDPLGQIPYSDYKIDNTIAGTNPIVFPATDWKKMIIKDYTTTQRYNLNLQGGGGVARYYVSAAYNKDNGILNVDKRNNFNSNISLKNYSLRSNITIDATKTTQMIVRLSGNFDDYTGPISNDGNIGGGAQMYDNVMHTNPVLFPAYYPLDEQHQYVKHIMYGNFLEGGYLNPYAELTKGYQDRARSLMLAQIELKQDLSMLTKGLSVRTMINTNRESSFDVKRAYEPFYYSLSGYDQISNNYFLKNINEQSATEYLGYAEGPKNITSTFYMESMMNYNRAFNKHTLSGLLVYIMRNSLAANQGSLQLSLPFRNVGLSGRTTYSYDDRYFAEFNFGYNGSERFYKSNRFGFFPAAGVAWNVSNEKFFQPLSSVISGLKLRATYGLVGNDAIGSPTDRFFYLSEVDMNNEGRRAFFGNREGTESYVLNGIRINRYANTDITWETSYKRNIAIELGLFKQLNIIAEYYDESRKNILMNRSTIPVTMGLATDNVRANVGEASGRGTDISLNYSKNFKSGLSLSVTGNFTYATSKFKVYEEPNYKEAYRSHVGNSIFQQYGLIAERLFIDDKEALNSPRQEFGQYLGGDIKYLDVNRDGKITNADMVPIGYPTMPEIVYGFGFSTTYKGFDFSAFFQGLANESFWIDVAKTTPFNNQTQVLKAYADSYWSEDNRDVYALWPRLAPYVVNNNSQTSTWFMRNGAFLRLKQVEFGYTLPDHLIKRVYASNVRVYVNCSNLLTFSKFRLWDVEMAGNGLGYPIQRVFNVGLNVSFN